MEYLNKGIKYDDYKNNSKVELITKKIDKPQNASKDTETNNPNPIVEIVRKVASGKAE